MTKRSKVHRKGVWLVHPEARKFSYMLLSRGQSVRLTPWRKSRVAAARSLQSSWASLFYDWSYRPLETRKDPNHRG